MLGEFEVSILRLRQQTRCSCGSPMTQKAKLCRKCKAKTLAKIRWGKRDL